MDISKASNFERFMFDIAGRDAAQLSALWQRLARDGQFDLADTPMWPRVAASGFVSGTSTHADRLATIRDVYHRFGTLIDPHTADGVKVGRDFREPGVPLICLETALPAKFAATIREARRHRAAASADIRRSRVAAAALHEAARGRGAGGSLHRRARRYAGQRLI